MGIVSLVQEKATDIGGPHVFINERFWFVMVLLYKVAQCLVKMGPELGPSTVGARYSEEKLDLKTPPPPSSVTDVS